MYKDLSGNGEDPLDVVRKVTNRTKQGEDQDGENRVRKGGEFNKGAI